MHTCKFQWSSIYHGLAPFCIAWSTHKLPCGTIKGTNIQMAIFQSFNSQLQKSYLDKKIYFNFSSDKYLTTKKYVIE
jgi:hypothetical protein